MTRWSMQTSADDEHIWDEIEAKLKPQLIQPAGLSIDAASEIDIKKDATAELVRVGLPIALIPPHPLGTSVKSSKLAFEGCVDGLDPRWNVVGWARLPADAEQRLQVALFVGSRVAAVDVAERFRGDLLDVQYGDGKYGFQLSIPAELFNGARHQLEVRVRSGPGGDPRAARHCPAHADAPANGGSR